MMLWGFLQVKLLLLFYLRMSFVTITYFIFVSVYFQVTGTMQEVHFSIPG